MTDVIEFSDLGEAVKRIDLLSEKMRVGALEALNEAADFMVTIAQGHCLVDTGTLQSSIRKEKITKGVRVIAGGMGYINPKNGRGCDYAIWVEQKNPFMRPAYETVRRFIEQLIRKKVLERVRV